ncbi:MAG: response regulator transcription factor [Candidatus Gastranaerophilales bacterium]|nr:response regulator transcription factor [Candidatus Gastranaerophilales bacterium]
MEKNSVNVLIVEDHSLTLFGLKTVFKEQDFIGEIFEAQNAADAIEYCHNKKIDIAIIDLGLPDMDGITLTKQIKQLSNQTKIVILTSHKTKEDVTDALKSGASAYCNKEIDIMNLLKVIEQVNLGALWIDPAVSKIVIDTLCTGRHNDFENINKYCLTEREKSVLKLMCEGLTNLEMSNKLSVSIHTIKAHICSILQKLSVEDRTRAVIKALKTNI